MNHIATQPTEGLLDTEKAGEFLGYTARQVRNLANRGILPVVRFPGCSALRFRPESLCRIVEQSETTAK